MSEDGDPVRRRTFLRATGAAGAAVALGAGDVVATGTCGDTSESTTNTGFLSGGGDGDEYYFSTALSDPCEVVYTLTSTDDVDFDLYVTVDGSTPTPSDYDYSSATSGTDERVEIDGGDVDANSEYGVLVHSYAGSGDYTLDAEEYGIGDDGGSTDAPHAEFYADDTEVIPGENVTFDAYDSYDPDGYIQEYYWEFGDGTSDYGEVVSHDYDDEGDYQVTLTVTDDDGATDAASLTIEVFNARPEPSFTVGDDTPSPGTSVTFDASGSSDADGEIIDYDWRFGDGTTATGEVVSHTYDDPGTYTVELTVTDEDTATETATRSLDVANDPPTADIGVSSDSLSPGDTLTADASGSSDDDGSLAAYDWQFGDGTTATGVRADHSYDDPGYYDLALTVTDDDGAAGTATREIEVVNANLDVQFSVSAESVSVGERVAVDAAATSDPDDEIRAYDWQFGDGTTATGVTAGHSYGDPGTFTITLTVTDEHGYTKSASQTVEVTNAKPTADATASTTAPETGDPVTFDGSGSSDPDAGDSVASHEWTFPGGLFGPDMKTGQVVTHEFDSAGTYDITLTVTDEHGAKDTDTVTVDVESGGGGFW